MRIGFQHSLVHRFAIAASAIAVVVGLLAGGLALSVVRSFAWQSIVSRLESVANVTAHRVELILDHILSNISGLAHNPILINATAESQGHEVSLQSVLSAFQQQHDEERLTIGLYDIQGNPSVVAAPSPPVAAQDPSVKAALEGSKSVARIEDNSLIVALPIVFPGSETTGSVLVARFALATLLAKASVDSTDGISVNLEWESDEIGEPPSPPLAAEKKLEVAAPLNGLGGHIHVRADESKLLQPVAAITRAYIVIGSAATIVVFILARLIGRRLAGPLINLSQVARTVAVDGRFDHAIPVSGKDEVADLAMALKAMLERLQQSHRTLEIRVEERTAELRGKEAELTHQASRLSAILEHVIDGIITVNSSGTILSVNQAAERLFGYEAAEMVGRNVSLLMPEPYHSAHDSYLAHYLKTGESRIIGIGRQLSAQRRDGSQFPMELAISVIQGPSPIFISVVRDITERVRIQETMQAARDAAEAAARQKSEFLSTMTHEIRTPMNGILGMLNILMTESLPPNQRRHVEVAHRSARSLLTLINDILDFSKIEAGRLTLEISDFSLSALVDEALSIIAPTAAAKGISLQNTSEQALPPWVKGDRARILQVLLNLLSNAVKFTETGSVTLRLSRQDDGLKFAVVDTGIGIAPEDQSRLFTRFTQLEGSLTRKYGGTGLGLAISRHLAEAMGGSIGVASTPGAGSLFWFTVPLVEGHEYEEAANGTEWRFSGHVLLADDSETNQLVAVSLLECTGLTVDCVDDGRAAVDAVQRRPYDLVLMDVAMPVMDGLSATQAIRALPGPVSKLPIIAMTAFSMIEDTEKCLAAGMNGFVIKPIDPPVLYARIAAWLGGGASLAPPPSNILDDAVIRRMEETTGYESTRRIANKLMTEIETRAERIVAASGTSDLETVSREAHTLKSLAGTFGAEDLRRLAADMERDARTGAAVPSEPLAAAARATVAALKARFSL